MKTLSILSFLFLGLAGHVFSAEKPAERLREAVDEALDVLYGEHSAEWSINEKRNRVRGILEQSYDLTVMIRRAIGRNWSLLDAEEQDRVVDLIKQLVVKAYIEGMQGKARPEVSFGDTIEISDKRLEIPSTIHTGDKTYSVVYRMGRLESGWQIYDIVAEDISMVSNYRQQFDDHFRKGNGKELIRKLEELLQKEDLDEEVKI